MNINSFHIDIANSGIPVSLPEHATVRCAEGRLHEQGHKLMASMGLSRLDDLSLWTKHCLRRFLPWAPVIKLYSRLLRELGLFSGFLTVFTTPGCQLVLWPGVSVVSWVKCLSSALPELCATRY